MGSAILEFSADYNYINPIIRFGVPDKFIEHGSQVEQRKESGYDEESITKKIKSILAKEKIN